MSFKGKTIGYLTVLLSALLIGGCDTNTSTDSITNPNPETFKPLGTIVGTLLDKTTDEPIVGAVIDIGVKTATTNANGIFVLSNLAATKDATGSSSTLAGTYRGTINFQNVTSPINMQSSGNTSSYPERATITAFSVEYNSLEDSSLTGGNDTLASNHDTPVDGLVGSVGWTQGKLSTTLSGEIRDKVTNALVTEAYTVQLFSDPGAKLLQEMTTTTGSESAFSFSGVEASSDHKITVFNSTNSMHAVTAVFTTPADNQKATLAVGGTAQPILVAETDDADPYIYNIAISDGTDTFESNADIGTAAMATVAFTFSEAIKANGYANGVTAAAATDLYDAVTVAVTGSAGTFAHSLAWDSSMTVLSVTIPALSASSEYTITIAAAAAGANAVMDVNNEPLDIANSNGESGGAVVATFTTSNPVAVTAPTVVVLNSSSLDEAAFAVPNLDWTWGAGASYYNLYRTDTTAGVVTSAMQLINNGALTASSFIDQGAASNSPVTTYVDGELAVTYTYVAKAVNADGIESDGSTAVVAADLNGPVATGAACAGTDVTVSFAGGTEVLAEGAAETAANYTLGGADTALTISSIVAGTNSAVLTLNGNCTGGATVAVGVGVTDIAGNAHAATPSNTAGTASAALAY